MGVVYYKYKSEKEVNSMPLAHAFISAYELKQLILTSDRHGRGRTRGRGPREGIAISNAQTGEDYTDGNVMIPQNTTVLVRRTAGQQLSENIVLVSSRNVTEGCSIPSNKSVVTDSSSKSLSSTEVEDEDAAIEAVIDAAGVKWEDHRPKNTQAGGRFTSGSRYGHGPLEGGIPPPGYVCRSCGVPGHFIQHCTRELKNPPPGYICYRCQIPGHFIQNCPTIGDTNFDNKMTRSLAPVVTPSPADGILESLVPSASASAVDDLPAELHCQLCKKVMTDAVLTSKCCFDSFCDKCIRDYIITQSKCICGSKVLADSLIPNHTLRSTISNMLSTRAGSSSSGKKSSSGSNPDPKLQSQAPSAASEREEMKQPMDHHVSEHADTPDGGLQVPTKGDVVNQSLVKLVVVANVDALSKDEVSSAELSVEKAVANAENLKLQNRSESTLKVNTVSGTLGQNATKTDQPKKKRTKAASAKVILPSNADFGYNMPMDPAYYNPFVGGYPWTDPYMYGSMGMPYGGYPMGPYGVNPMNIPPQAPLMSGYPPNYNWQAQPPLQQRSKTAARSERPKDADQALRGGGTRSSSEFNRQRGSSHVSESRNRTRSSPERRDHRRSNRPSDDYEDHGRKRMRDSSPMDDGGRQSSRRSAHRSRSRTREVGEDSSDDERNFKRRWGSRSSATVDPMN